MPPLPKTTVVRDCVENRDDGWWLAIFTEEGDRQVMLGQYGPHSTTEMGEADQKDYHDKGRIVGGVDLPPVKDAVG